MTLEARAPRFLRRNGRLLIAGVAAGLFCGRALSEFVPDTLGVGAAMFAAGTLVGAIIGLTWSHVRAAGGAGRGS